ncbi:hypothetical protein ACU8KH_01423 [Lachancea thermotolerans]
MYNNDPGIQDSILILNWHTRIAPAICGCSSDNAQIFVVFRGQHSSHLCPCRHDLRAFVHKDFQPSEPESAREKRLKEQPTQEPPDTMQRLRPYLLVFHDFALPQTH